jgi:hypothetical protein
MLLDLFGLSGPLVPEAKTAGVTFPEFALVLKAIKTIQHFN